MKSIAAFNENAHSFIIYILFNYAITLFFKVQDWISFSETNTKFGGVFGRGVWTKCNFHSCRWGTDGLRYSTSVLHRHSTIL